MDFDFQMAENEDTGFLGLQAMFMKGAEPAEGFTCAHDIMEHFQGIALDSDSEAMALGAMLYIRGHGGYFNRRPGFRSVGYLMSSDVARLFTDPGVTQTIEEEAEAWIEEAIRLGLREIEDERYDDTDPRPHSEWGKWVRGWLRKGYRKARKRYTLDPMTLCDTFERMTEGLDNARRYMEEGDIVRVSFVQKTCKLSVRTINRWEPEHPDYDPDMWEE
jgi:hypothetical protein